MKGLNMLWKVTIEETVSEEFNVSASTIEEAEAIAREKYRKGEFVLEPGNLTSALMEVRAVDGSYCSDWTEI